jgi:L-2-hydroxyglutarate oxidase LhgO
MTEVDVTVIGGGVVGCCVAAETARRGLATVLLEKESRLATGITARNSEVAHGGMYYPAGSLKARFCVRGRRLLKEFCAAAGVSYREIGKVIVAVTPEEEGELERLLDLGRENGVEELRLIGARELRRLEPHVVGVAALHSPRTGILDAEGVARAYGRLAAERGAQVLTAARVIGLEPAGSSWRVEVRNDSRAGWTHASRWLVNAAGLHADAVAALAGVAVDDRGFRQHWVKGNYFAVAPRHAARIGRLIYPVPPSDGSSLGVHVCVDLAGQLRLGPDFEPVDRREDYRVDPERRDLFYRSAAMFLPFLAAEDLAPGMSGIRPKLATDGFADFHLERHEGQLAGLISLIGIDSPGLTAAPAIAEAVGDMLED